MWHIIRSFKGQKLWLRHLFKMCANLSNLFYICQLSIKWSYILSCILLFITAQCFVGKKKRDIFFLCKTSFLNWTIISFFLFYFTYDIYIVFWPMIIYSQTSVPRTRISQTLWMAQTDVKVPSIFLTHL